MNTIIKVAAVQTDPKLMENEKNLEKMLALTGEAASNARLITFPECALCGYVYRSREEAVLSAQPVPGPAAESM